MEDIVQLDTHYTRSINLERDADSCEILQAYIPTSRAIQTLDKIADTFNTGNVPRAWSLVGPYGSGKSSFAAFLSHLLEDQNRDTNKIAKDILKRYNQQVADKIIAHTSSDTNAYCIVLLTGSAESLSKRFVEALYQSTLLYWSEKPPTIVQELEQALMCQHFSGHTVKQLFAVFRSPLVINSYWLNEAVLGYKKLRYTQIYPA